jgi:hypothetical protein
VVVVHRAKEKAEEKRNASAKGDRAIARNPNAKGVVRPANGCLAEPEAVSLREPMEMKWTTRHHSSIAILFESSNV